MATIHTNSRKQLTLTEYKKLLEIFDEADTAKRDLLTEWEQNFLTNVKEGVIRYEIYCILSEKQRLVLERIEKKLFTT